MPDVLYVCLQDDDKLAAFAIGADGRLGKQGETALPGGPSVMALGPNGQTLYVGQRTSPAISRSSGLLS